MLARNNSLRNSYKHGHESNTRSTLLTADSSSWPPPAPSSASHSVTRNFHGHIDQPPPYLDYNQRQNILLASKSLSRDTYPDHDYRSQHHQHYHSGVEGMQKAISLSSLPTSHGEAVIRDRNSKLRNSNEYKQRKVAPSHNFRSSYLTPLPQRRLYY